MPLRYPKCVHVCVREQHTGICPLKSLQAVPGHPPTRACAPMQTPGWANVPEHARPVFAPSLSTPPFFVPGLLARHYHTCCVDALQGQMACPRPTTPPTVPQRRASFSSRARWRRRLKMLGHTCTCCRPVGAPEHMLQTPGMRPCPWLWPRREYNPDITKWEPLMCMHCVRVLQSFSR